MNLDLFSKAKNILQFHIEPAGYGATLSRLMVATTLCIKLDAAMIFTIESGYLVNELFNIRVFEPSTSPAKKVFNWNFFRDTWDNPSRNETIYPNCPYDDSMSKHVWASLTAKALFGTPKAVLRAHIAGQKTRIRWDDYEIHIGLHIRRGDKTLEHPHVPVPIYLRFLEEELKRYDGKRVGIYLSSDDPNVRKEIPYENVMWDDTEQRYNNSNINMVRSTPHLAAQESITAARIICIFGECDAVIGLENTQFTWIGGLLMKNFDPDRHIMINPRTGIRGHWGAMYTTSAQ